MLSTISRKSYGRERVGARSVAICLHFLPYFILDSEVPTAMVIKSSIFWDTMQLCLLPASCSFPCLDYSSTLKMKATCSSEKSIDFQQTTRRYIPELLLLLLLLFNSCCSLRSIRHPWNAVSLQFLNLRQSVGLLWRGISPPQGSYLHRTTQT
jgi:hypothetical protein